MDCGWHCDALRIYEVSAASLPRWNDARTADAYHAEDFDDDDEP
jgi:hypothetical protein